MLDIAPTGTGKGRSAIIPNLLTYPGPVTCVDPKGENAQVTARRRREMGQEVVILDPFRTVTDHGDALNPYDLFALPGSEIDGDSEMLVDLITGGDLALGKDPFWDLTAGGLLTGLVGYAAELDDPKNRRLGTALDLLHHDDVDYHLAVLLDNHKFKTPLVRQEIAGYLSHEGERCRPSVRSTAQAKVKTLGGAAARRSLHKSTFDLQAVLRGDPLSIFLASYFSRRIWRGSRCTPSWRSGWASLVAELCATARTPGSRALATFCPTSRRRPGQGRRRGCPWPRPHPPPHAGLLGSPPAGRRRPGTERGVTPSVSWPGPPTPPGPTLWTFLCVPPASVVQ